MAVSEGPAEAMYVKSSKPSAERDQMTHMLAAKFTNIRKAFHHVDVNNDGVVTKNEIKRYVCAV